MPRRMIEVLKQNGNVTKYWFVFDNMIVFWSFISPPPCIQIGFIFMCHPFSTILTKNHIFLRQF
jgi:hypothetical protein